MQAGDVGDRGALTLKLEVYLPSRKPIHVRVFEVATVDEAISEIFKVANAAKEVLPGTAECYELRLHEGDGYPEEDFPALDRARKIKHFSDDGSHEYCIVGIPAKLDAAGPSELQNVGKQTNRTLLRVLLPNGLFATVDATGKTLRDVLPGLAKKHQMGIFAGEVQFTLNEKDRVSLNMTSPELPLDTAVRQLGIKTGMQVTLSRKSFADAPGIQKTRKDGGMMDSKHGSAGHRKQGGLNGDASRGGGRRASATKSRLNRLQWVMSRRAMQKSGGSAAEGVSQGSLSPSGSAGDSNPGQASAAAQRPDESTFLFNAVTASEYSEWNVYKTNRWGFKQKRVIGVDLGKIYNKRRPTKESSGPDQVKRTHRDMADVINVRYVPGSATQFRISFRDEKKDMVTLDYEAETPRDCAEIVAKIRYIKDI
eukprot:g1024.t1